MNEFIHVRMILGLVLSLCLALLLRGVSKLIIHPMRSRPYAVHLLWAAYVFLDIISFWWWEYKLNQIAHWTFLIYLLIIVYIVLYYLLCSLLFPEDISEYKGYKDYYYARRRWFFGILALTYPMDVLDTYVKGTSHLLYLDTNYLVRTSIYVLFCLIAAKWNNERYHTLLAILMIVDFINWVIQYNQLI